jgi:hypothetical protein
MPFADHDDVVQAFTSNRPDHHIVIAISSNSDDGQ